MPLWLDSGGGVGGGSEKEKFRKQIPINPYRAEWEH